MLRFLMTVAVITVSAMVSGAAGMFVGARSATEAGSWLDRARNAFHEGTDGAAAEDRRAAVQRRLAAELDAVPPARERWAASEGDGWNGGSPYRRDPRPGIRNTLYEDDRWSDDTAGRRMNREARRDGRERRLRDDEQNNRDRRAGTTTGTRTGTTTKTTKTTTSRDADAGTTATATPTTAIAGTRNPFATASRSS